MNKIKQLDRKIDEYLGRKLGPVYTEINNWCNGHVLVLGTSAAFLIAVLIILNMQHIK